MGGPVAGTVKPMVRAVKRRVEGSGVGACAQGDRAEGVAEGAAGRRHRVAAVAADNRILLGPKRLRQRTRAWGPAVLGGTIGCTIECGRDA